METDKNESNGPKLDCNKKAIKELHVVSFDVPFPPNYGGVIDVFYKIRSLHQLGVKVHLHCFKYGREESVELEKYCTSVTYYKRKAPWKSIFSLKPLIVSSRENKTLFSNLNNDNFPVLLEGVHCSGFLMKNESHKPVFLRNHNIEQDYYNGLAKVERNRLKRIYYRLEAWKLNRVENWLEVASGVLAISPADTEYLSKKMKNVSYLPVFHSSDKNTSPMGQGAFMLYHGNLSVGENVEAALFLINKVFSRRTELCVIAGNNPHPEIAKAVERYEHIELKSGLNHEELNKLIASAQVNVLPTFQPTGIKLKLLSALFRGRHCVVNDNMVSNTGLAPLCHVVAHEEDYQSILNVLWSQPFEKEDIHERNKVLGQNFSNELSARALVQLVFGD